MPSTGVFCFKRNLHFRRPFGSMKNESGNLDDDEKNTFKNKFELIDIAARRARKLRNGKRKLIEINSDKEPVIALNEIYSGRLKFEVEREEEDEAAGN
jgi:DNA-directed RNA polymerase omega subunit